MSTMVKMVDVCQIGVKMGSPQHVAENPCEWEKFSQIKPHGNQLTSMWSSPPNRCCSPLLSFA